MGKRNGKSDIDTRAEPKLVIACTNADINTIMNEVMYCSGVTAISPLIIKTKKLLQKIVYSYYNMKKINFGIQYQSRHLNQNTLLCSIPVHEMWLNSVNQYWHNAYQVYEEFV
jgi:hypothetical protein